MPRARPLAPGSALARGPASRVDLFSPPRHPRRPQRWPRCSELDAMGLPEERRKSGSGSRAREETGAEGWVRGWSPPPEVTRSAHVPSLQRYRELHRRSVEEPRGEAGPGRLSEAPVSRGAGVRGGLTELREEGRRWRVPGGRWKRDSKEMAFREKEEGSVRRDLLEVGGPSGRLAVS